jgi:gamma-glutamyltranspeptidase/glutathione hydrolase
MAPLMVLQNAKPVLCQGAPGARRIMNRGVQVVANMVSFGMSPQEAIIAPTVDASGKDTLVDSRLPEAVIRKLKNMGHNVTVVEEEPGMTGNFARPSAIQIDYENKLLRAGVDPFRPAVALGY